MRNLQKTAYIFLFIFIQTVLAISGGLAISYFSARECIPSNVYVGTVSLGGLSREEAGIKLKEKLQDIVENGAVAVKFGNRDYRIDYRDLDTVLDYEACTGLAYGKKWNEHLLDLTAGLFNPPKRIITPVLKVNEEKLKQKIVELSAFIDTPPLNANISIVQDKVKKTPEVDGIKLNLENAFIRLKKDMGASLESYIEFKVENHFEIGTVKPQIAMSDLEGLDEVIADYSTDIKSSEYINSMKIASHAISRVVLLPAAGGDRGSAGVFSFNKWLSQQKALSQKEDEGYDQVASTLYAAVLKVGIRPDAVTRVQHETPPEYIEPGLDARVSGDKYDFKFVNTLEHRLAVFAEIKDNKVIVRLVGKKAGNRTANGIKVDILQRFEPSVIHMENRNLKPGERKQVSPGIEGLSVNVYRNEELLYSDTYKAIEAIVEIGPDTGWGNDSDK